jgi:hypothetical protein
MMIPIVTRVRPKDGYVLWVKFSDGAEGEWDFADIFDVDGPMVAPLRDQAYFRRVFIERGALTWPNGFDAAPDALYGDMVAAKRLRWPSRAA